MKMRTLLSTAAFLGSVLSALAVPVEWHGWAVHGGSTVDDGLGNITFTAGTNPAYTWSTGGNGVKAFYSTGDFNGQALSVLNTLTYGGGPAYFNIFVTNGVDNAVLLPMLTNNINFSTASYSVFETTNSSWLANDFTGSTSWATVSALGNLIGSGPYAGQAIPQGGWAAWGLENDGLSLVWGNRGGDPGYGSPITINNVTLNGLAGQTVPDTGVTLVFVGLTCVGLTALRRRLDGSVRAV